VTTYALVGAGPGLGLSCARRFGAAGHGVDRAGTSIAFAGESAYAAMLHDALAAEHIHTAQLIIPGAIRPEAEHSSPQALAERLYALHTERDGFRHYAEPLPT
jgi:NAD(P)-dependent dehydrogenase (short-subunit alcohol dehydrogenase family)